MTTMNPYYAHESDVGAVFDVAHYSSRKALFMAFVGVVFAAFVGAAAAYVWKPDWFIRKPPVWYADAHQDVKDLMRQHPTGAKIGVGVAGLFAAVFFLAAASCVFNALSGNYYIRVGENGLSLRLPDSFFTAYERDLGWPDIAKVTVVQEKRFGALSQSSGNLGGELQLRLRDGDRRDLRLDHFREDAWLIYNRIQEAQEMQPAILA